MTMYRTRCDLQVKKDVYYRGSVFDGKLLPEESIRILCEMKKITPVAPPPLAVLPGWKTRSSRLVKYNILTISDFLETPNEDLQEIFTRVKPQTLVKWKNDLEKELIVPKPEG